MTRTHRIAGHDIQIAARHSSDGIRFSALVDGSTVEIPYYRGQTRRDAIIYMTGWLDGRAGTPEPSEAHRVIDSILFDLSQGRRTTREIASAAGMSTRTAHYYLSRLVSEGRVMRSRPGLEVAWHLEAAP